MKKNDDDINLIVHLPESAFDEVPGELDERMAGLFSALRRQELKEHEMLKLRRLRRHRVVAAAALTVILLLSFVGPKQVWTAGSDAVAVIIKTFQSFTTLNWEKDSETTHVRSRIDNYDFTYLPEGMSIDRESDNAAARMIRFENKAGDSLIYLQQLSSSVGLLIDTEDTNIHMMKEAGRLYYYYVNKDVYNIVWEIDGQVISLNSNLDFDVLFKVARGLRQSN